MVADNLTKRVARRLVESPSFQKIMVDTLAAHLEVLFQAEFGGERIYIPKTMSGNDRDERDRLIREAFTGNNWDFLEKRFKLTRRQLRRIICKKSDTPA